MDETLTTPAAPRTKADYQAEIERLLVEIRRGNERWQERRAESERRHAEIRAIGEHTDAVLDRLDAQLEELRKTRRHVEATA